MNFAPSKEQVDNEFERYVHALIYMCERDIGRVNGDDKIANKILLYAYI